MTEEEFKYWLLFIFIGLLALLFLGFLHRQANPNRSELDQVLMRNDGSGQDE